MIEDREKVLNGLISRERTLIELEKSIKNSSDNGDRVDDLELYMELSKRYNKKLYEILIEEIQENTKTLKRIQDSANETNVYQNKYQELCDAFISERQQNKEFFENVAMAMLINPREGFQILLDHIERNEKIEDLTGQGWRWNLKFRLPARIQIAYKLLFG